MKLKKNFTIYCWKFKMNMEKLANSYYNRGLAWAQQNHISEATAELKKAVSLYPKHTTAWNLLGLCYYRLGLFKSAEYCWRESLQQAADMPNEAKRYLEDLNTTLNHIRPVLKNIHDLIDQKHYRQAGRRWEEEIINTLDPSVSLYNYGGILYYLGGNRPKALYLWQNALIMDLSNQQTTKYISYSNFYRSKTPLKRVKESISGFLNHFHHIYRRR